ncbi:MAG TPA: outer membrane beta-barrel protein [Puia sp.]|nr:outer membrane beta-barrel protein [Puia sp.]
MMERHDHNNPWADKLQDIRLPDENVSWMAMEAVLDREMPVNRWRDKRRWWLLIILLLLLIGVCNCPGRRLMGDRETMGRVKEAPEGVGGEPKSGSEVPGGKTYKGDTGDGRRTTNDTGSDRRTISRGLTDDTVNGKSKIYRVTDTPATKKDRFVYQGAAVPDSAGGSGGPGKPDGSARSDRPGVSAGSEGRMKGGGTKGGRKLVVHAVGKKTTDEDVVVTGRRHKKDKGGTVKDTASVRRPGAGLVGGPGPVNSSGRAGGPGVDSTGDAGSVVGPGRMNSPGLVATAKKDTVKVDKGKKHNDSTAAAVKKPKADSILQMKGWLAGIGLNQFFTVGGQQQSNFNSNGTTGGISDYIPVPMVRYYFNRKLYVQLEAQFNTPQYTTKDLLASKTRDSVSRPGQVLQSSLFIKKLFYFNLPLSIHYSPIPNLYIGGGIQYARLTNGVALYQDSSHRIFTGVDSFVSSKIQSFKNDTTYKKLKTNEFRLMLDLNYNFKRFVVGARYNRALSDFINLRISTNQVTQSRNSSFQVYLRYIIWDGRKKALLPK